MVKLLELAGCRSGNEAVCKTAMQGSDSPPGLIFIHFVFSSVMVDFRVPQGYTWRNSAQADFFV